MLSNLFMSKRKKTRMRVAGPADLPVLLEIMRESRICDDVPFDSEDATVAISELIFNPERGRVWFFDRHGVVLGYLIVRICKGETIGHNGILVDEFYVRPRSSGKELIAMALEVVAHFCQEIDVRAYHQPLGQAYLLTTWMGGIADLTRDRD
jgi:hypothetical protein